MGLYYLLRRALGDLFLRPYSKAAATVYWDQISYQE
jgi:hypothetical protein